MEFPQSYEPTETAIWPSQYSVVIRNSAAEDLMNYGANSSGRRSSPGVTEQMSFFCEPYPLPSLPSSYVSAEAARNFAFPGSLCVPVSDTFNVEFQGDDGPTAKAESNINISFQQNVDVLDRGNLMIARPLRRQFPERLLGALSVFKDLCSGGGILAQVWLPIQQASREPNLAAAADEKLPAFPEISRASAVAVDGDPSFLSELSDHIVCEIVPEWTLNAGFYNLVENKNLQYAHHIGIHEFVLPVYDPNRTEKSTFAALKLVTVKDNSNLDSDIQALCYALKAANLSTSAASGVDHQTLSKNQSDALLEINVVLRAACMAHRLPLALTWIRRTIGERSVLCIQDMACCAYDRYMQGFLDACLDSYLKAGQGIAGEALQSNRYVFCPDIVEKYDISQYPLFDFALAFGLRAAVAIRLRSTYTGNDDYVLEFFLPLTMVERSEQESLLVNLSRTIQRFSRSLRTITDAELDGGDGTEVGSHREAAIPNFPPMVMPTTTSQTLFADTDEVEADGPLELGMGTEDEITHNELQLHCQSGCQYSNKDMPKLNLSVEDDDDRRIDLIHTGIPIEMIPQIGMEFETEKEGHNFYSAYASKVGFTIRKSKSHKEGNTVMDRTFCCSCEGKRGRDKRDVNVKLHRPETRVGCLAKIKINCRQTGKYRVIEFVAEHTHATSSPCKTSLVESQRNLTLAQKTVVQRAIAPKETLELMGEQQSEKFCQLVTQLATAGTQSEEKYKFIISGLGNMLEHVDAPLRDKGVEEITHVISHVNKSAPEVNESIRIDSNGVKISGIKGKGRIVGESSRPKSILDRTIKKKTPRNKALPPPNACVPVEQFVLSSTPHFMQLPNMGACQSSVLVKFTQQRNTSTCTRSLDGSTEPSKLAPLLHVMQPITQVIQQALTCTVMKKPFMSCFPLPIQPFIADTKDVIPDGNCGFRVVAALIKGDENMYVDVRLELLKELNLHVGLYTNLFGGVDRVVELSQILSHFDPRVNAPPEKWMSMPDMGHLIASAYNCAVFSLSYYQCITLLPLRTAPPPALSPLKEIGIGFVNNSHFIQVFIKSGEPVPPVSKTWDTFKQDAAKEWSAGYVERCRRFNETVSQTSIATCETVELDAP